uniref:Uncharacterized protein n=1 Tax=Ficus carica TaxID=3494 RepID=A0AA88JJC5_FICCA|nr:hypothetical protein TIFTF001_053873 [Ficus carica]GMN74587.1 hypothetical protein TIFTF001_053876 [Ficus carica]
MTTEMEIQIQSRHSGISFRKKQ